MLNICVCVVSLSQMLSVKYLCVLPRYLRCYLFNVCVLSRYLRCYLLKCLCVLSRYLRCYLSNVCVCCLVISDVIC